jgi:hypothetical protein
MMSEHHPPFFCSPSDKDFDKDTKKEKQKSRRAAKQMFSTTRAEKQRAQTSNTTHPNSPHKCAQHIHYSLLLSGDDVSDFPFECFIHTNNVTLPPLPILSPLCLSPSQLTFRVYMNQSILRIVLNITILSTNGLHLFEGIDQVCTRAKADVVKSVYRNISTWML